MKKSLLVLAVASALPVLAQAQSSVTLYGRMDAALAFENTGAGSTINVNQGVQSTSRWGLRGSEDLGGGLKAIFNVESGITNDTALPALDFRRRSVVGLEGGFGNLVLGRDYDPLFRVLLGSDTLGLGHYGNVHTIFGATTGYNGGSSYGVRIDNGIHYVTPSLGGFIVRAAYGFSERAVAPKSVGRAIGLSAEYAAGPLYVGLGYRQNSVLVGTAAVSDKFTALGARYNFGAFAINGGVGKVDPNGASNTKVAWVGGDVAIGSGRLHAQFGRMDPNGAGRATSLGVTYNQPLSKRTNVYVTVGQVSNNASSAFSLGYSNGSVAASAAGKDPRGVAIGVGHNF